ASWWSSWSRWRRERSGRARSGRRKRRSSVLLWGRRWSALGERAVVGEADRAVVPVQAGRAVAASGAELVGGHEAAGAVHLSAEVRGIQAALEHRFVDAAQFGEGEALAEEGGGDTGVLDLVAQPPQGVLDDQGVVEGELGQLIGDEP